MQNRNRRSLALPESLTWLHILSPSLQCTKASPGSPKKSSKESSTPHFPACFLLALLPHNSQPAAIWQPTLGPCWPQIPTSPHLVKFPHLQILCAFLTLPHLAAPHQPPSPHPAPHLMYWFPFLSCLIRLSFIFSLSLLSALLHFHCRVFPCGDFVPPPCWEA